MKNRTRFGHVSGNVNLLTKQQLCDWWGVEPSCICRWVQAGLPEIELSDKLRFYRISDVEEFIINQDRKRKQ